MHWVKRRRKRDDHPETWDGIYGFKRTNLTTQQSEIIRLQDQINILKQTVMKKDGTFKEYGSARNTSGGGPIILGDPVDEGAAGPPGPPGPQGVPGPSGSKGATGDDGSYDIMTLTNATTATGVSSNTRLYNMNFKITGTGDMLASNQAIRSVHSQVPTSNWTVDVLTLNFKPGQYKVTLTYRLNNAETIVYGFDTNHNRYMHFPNNSSEDGQWHLVDGGHSGTDITMFEVGSVTNFHLGIRDSAGVRDSTANKMQIMFERIGDVESDGQTDQIIAYPLDGTLGNNTQEFIHGGIYWGTTIGMPPTHSVTGNVIEHIVIGIVDAAKDAADAVTDGWIHRIIPRRVFRDL